MELKARCIVTKEAVCLEFGRTQAQMSFSARGSIARKLKLKDGDKVSMSMKKLRP